MIEAGKEEKWLAEQAGDYFDGVPAITVTADGAGPKGPTNIHMWHCQEWVWLLEREQARSWEWV